jgi:hypothetical protein
VRCVEVRHLCSSAIYVFGGCVMRASGFYSLGSRHISSLVLWVLSWCACRGMLVGARGFLFRSVLVLFSFCSCFVLVLFSFCSPLFSFVLICSHFVLFSFCSHLLSKENAQACSNMAPYRFLSAVRAYGRCECREVLGSEYVRCVGVRYLFLFAFCVFDGCVVRAYGLYSLGSRHISGF